MAQDASLPRGMTVLRKSGKVELRFPCLITTFHVCNFGRVYGSVQVMAHISRDVPSNRLVI